MVAEQPNDLFERRECEDLEESLHGGDRRRRRKSLHVAALLELTSGTPTTALTFEWARKSNESAMASTVSALILSNDARTTVLALMEASVTRPT